MTTSIPRGANVILIDGECVYCNRVASFILRHNRGGIFSFSHLQGRLAKDVLHRHGQTSDDVDSVYVMLDAGTPDERLLRDGMASRAIWSRLFWFAGILRWVPLPLLDGVYRAFAKRRYRFFGKYETCHVPSSEERGRFLDLAPAEPGDASAA
jgi:predicted DCC family thiol-disulfide oxidoreductase YuxK